MYFFGQLLLPIACLFVSVFPYSAVARSELNGLSSGDWRFECATKPDVVEICALMQTIFDANTKIPVVRIAFAKDSANGVFTVSIFLPVGVDLLEHPILHAGQIKFALDYRLCLSDGCLAVLAVAADELKKLAMTDRLLIEFKAVGRVQPIMVQASSVGLGNALSLLGFLNVK